MLLQFSVADFRSINQRVTLSMVARGINNIPQNNYASIDGVKILKSAVIYGANKSMAEMANIVLNSVKLNFDDEINYEDFLSNFDCGIHQLAPDPLSGE